MPITSGDTLGRYEILGPIGAGGMGEVFRARDNELERQEAIKVLPGHMAADSSARERLRREALAAASGSPACASINWRCRKACGSCWGEGWTGWAKMHGAC